MFDFYLRWPTRLRWIAVPFASAAAWSVMQLLFSLTLGMAPGTPFAGELGANGLQLLPAVIVSYIAVDAAAKMAPSRKVTVAVVAATVYCAACAAVGAIAYYSGASTSLRWLVLGLNAIGAVGSALDVRSTTRRAASIAAVKTTDAAA